jgi:hypothetical protein
LLKRLGNQLGDPIGFYNGLRNESYKPAFLFFVQVTLFISMVTPVVNLFGLESTDFSASYQAQITAYNLVKINLLPVYGASAYLIEPVLIFVFSIAILVLMTLFIHLIYRMIGGKGKILNAWKAACYGTGPCLLGGFLPYIALFAGFYSFAMQFYLGPTTLYDARQGRSIVIFVVLIASTFIEMLLRKTTAGLW